jgi:hypothetical protein
VLFRKHMILGRMLRFRGRFKESHLNFDEDLHSLICDLADTLRELNDTVSAERHLRMEIARRKDRPCSSGRSLLELSLAEALFAQGCSKEAEDLCLRIQSRPNLLKFEKLRLCIILAKLRHIASDDEGAFSH